MVLQQFQQSPLDDCLVDDVGPSLLNSPVCTGTFLFMVLLESYLKKKTCRMTDHVNRVRSARQISSEYDFIVVGGGTAGSIVAGRLSENSLNKVLVLEAGGAEPMGASVPSLYRTFWFNENVDWRYRTAPGDYCHDQNGLGCMWPRGKVIGGTNVLNGMMYHRGHPADYEDWVKAGAEGWSWEENLQYFDMTENNQQIGTLVGTSCHSKRGPLPVQQFKHQPKFVYELLHAVNEAGLPVIADMNDPDTPDGFTIAQTFTANGQRYTTARAFLEPQDKRPNLTVKMHVHVTRILINKMNQAYGVEYVDENGVRQSVLAKKEVILSAGALNTPQILLLSGVGPQQTLKEFNIPMVANLPVGLNMKNHLGMTFSFHLSKMENTETLDWNVLTQYLLDGTGPMSSTGITQLTGLAYSSLADKARKQPDLQFFFNGFYAECSETGKIGELVNDNYMNITINAVALLPRSVGYVTLNSTNPFDPLIFYPGFFSHPDDMVMVKDAGRVVEKIYNTEKLKSYGIRLDEAYSAACTRRAAEWSDAWLECMAREHTDPQNHQLGTAAIGQVVDTQLNVIGIERLRVIDASVMPTPPTGNPQGAIMMVAERGAELIKKTWKTPSQPATFPWKQFRGPYDYDFKY